MDERELTELMKEIPDVSSVDTGYIARIVATIDTLREEMDNLQRQLVFSHFCCHCGSTDTGCQCWNDE